MKERTSMKYLKKVDPQIDKLIKQEKKRQETTLMMIPSENIASEAVQEAVGSCLGNKYAEGYPNRRYYQGQEFVDQIENIAIERAKEAFDVAEVNVQPLSGSPANLAVYFGLIKPGDKIVGLDLAHGGHLTHGAKVSAVGHFFKPESYILGKNGKMDYDLIEKLVKRVKPKIIVAGITAYSLKLNWKRFAEIADSVGAYLMADIAHLAGLVAAGVYPSPAPYVHVITTTTHKTLRGPRGAMIMTTRKGLKKDPDLAKKIKKAVFPGLQGGPHMNAIAGIAIALKEAKTARFKKVCQQVVDNCKVLAEELKKMDYNVVSGGTETHLALIDLSNKKVIGNLAAEALERAGIVLNRNSVPFDQNPPFYPSGIRLGTPGLTSRGMKIAQMKKVAKFMDRVISDVARIKEEKGITLQQEKKKVFRKEIINKSKEVKAVRKEVAALCKKFPVIKEY